MGAVKMMEMYKTKATKAWQALERIIHLSRSATSPEETASSYKENENRLAGCELHRGLPVLSWPMLGLE